MEGLQIPSYLEGYVSQILSCIQDNVTTEGMWAVRLKLVPYRDGNQWHVLYGENITTGILGRGSSPFEAMQSFEDAMYEKIKEPTNV